MYEQLIPIVQPMGIDHHIPSDPILSDIKYAAGILIIQSENKVMNMGISVSPAPRKTPCMVNIDEKIR